MLRNFRYPLFFGIIAVLILWKLFLPGYVLTLDMVFTPQLQARVSEYGYYNFYPAAFLLSVFNTIIPAWIIQKIILFLLFFSFGFLSFRFLPLPVEGTSRLFSALLYTINPFVYSRFLAGHWTHLVAYALLPVFCHLVFSYTKDPSTQRSIFLFLCLSIFSIFSLHIFVMAVLFLVIWFLVDMKDLSQKFNFHTLGKSFLVGLGIFFIVSSYWIIPLFTHVQPFEKRFDIHHFEEFSPHAHGVLSPAWNVLSLHGFWAEQQGWGKQFVWLHESALFVPCMSVLAVLIGMGIFWGLKKTETQKVTLFFCIVSIFAFVFAMGLAATPFQDFNLWFYQHIPWWSGFRESQKFVALLALSYSIFSGMGIDFCLHLLKHRSVWVGDLFRYLIFLEIALLGIFLWGGFRGQLQSSWYPQSWFEAKEFLEDTMGGSQALFLPWHGYISFQFNQNVLLATPVQDFFGPRAIFSKNIELETVYDQEIDESYKKLDQALVRGDKTSGEEVISLLKEKNIKYIVFFQDLVSYDPYSYSFLTEKSVEEVFSRPEIKIFLIH